MVDESCERAGDTPVDSPADLSTTYNIVEIFHSVQGEGYRSGIPMFLFDLDVATYAANGATLTLIPTKK